jgi:transcriptional regulator GlxA family with amidase domain
MVRKPESHAELFPHQVRNVAIVAFDGMEIIDLTGPMEVFSFTNMGRQTSGLSTEPVYNMRVLAKQAGPVTASCGLRILADGAYSEVNGDIDTLIIPGSPDVNTILADPDLMAWLLYMSSRVRRLVSVCTGAFLLAKTGLLDDRCATTHWAFCDRLIADYPLIKVEPDRIFVHDDSISTSGGVTSGIDLALSLIEEDWGQEQALAVARYLVMFLKRPGGQSQFSGYLVSESTKNQDLRRLQMWIMENPSEDLRNEVLAEHMAMSTRNFARVFQEETGMTPAKFVEKARVDAARHLLGSTDHRIDSIAVMAGFGDQERMRRAFLRNLGINPQDYRERFRPKGVKPVPTVTERRIEATKAAWNAF